MMKDNDQSVSTYSAAIKLPVTKKYFEIYIYAECTSIDLKEKLKINKQYQLKYGNTHSLKHFLIDFNAKSRKHNLQYIKKNIILI